MRWLQQPRRAGSTMWAQLWPTSLAALWHVGSSWSRDRTHVPCIGRPILNQWTTREVHKIFKNFVLKFLLGLPGSPVVKTPYSQCKRPGFDPCQGTRAHMPQLKILHASTKIWYIQINRFFFLNFVCSLFGFIFTFYLLQSTVSSFIFTMASLLI